MTGLANIARMARGTATAHRIIVMEDASIKANARARVMDDIEKCAWCQEFVDVNSYEIEDEMWYCHNHDWVITEGTCWEQRVCLDFPEFKEWLSWGFECDGCVVSEEGECQCTSDGWKTS